MGPSGRKGIWEQIGGSVSGMKSLVESQTVVRALAPKINLSLLNRQWVAKRERAPKAGITRMWRGGIVSVAEQM